MSYFRRLVSIFAFALIISLSATLLANAKVDDYVSKDYADKSDYTADYVEKDNYDDEKEDYDKKDYDQGFDYEKVYGVVTSPRSTSASNKVMSGTSLVAPSIVEKDFDDDALSEIDGYITDRDGERKVHEVITSEDGTTKEVTRKSSRDGKIKIKEVLRDAGGNKLEVREGVYDPSNGEEGIQISVYDVYGSKITDVKITTTDGKKLTIKKSDGAIAPRVKYDIENDVLEIRTRGDYSEDDEVEEIYDRITIDADSQNFVIKRSGFTALTTLPVIVDRLTGKIYISTAVGDVEVVALPDTIIVFAMTEGVVHDVESVNLEDNSGPVYVVKGSKSENFLGIFRIQIPVTAVFDATTGTFVENAQAFWHTALDLFSV